MTYKPQYYPGNTSVAKNRRKHMSNKIEKLRDISDDDLTAIMGHRASGSDYPSTHPPLSEMGEPDCPIREIVEPTPGAAAGDRIRYVQFSDSMYNAPGTPYWRSYHAAMNFRGVDPGTLSGRQIVEMRERDLEAFTKRVSETEITDWGLAGMRGCTVHGHSLRLQEDGVMFDMLDRRRLENGVIVMDKDQVGVPIDRKVNLGKPMSLAEAARRTTIYRVDNVPLRKDTEVVEHVQRLWELRTIYGFQPAPKETIVTGVAAIKKIDFYLNDEHVDNSGGSEFICAKPGDADEYLWFSWDRIPGDHSGNIGIFLKRHYSIELLTARIEKSRDEKTINVTDGLHSLSIELDDEKLKATKAFLEIDDGRTDEFAVKMEEGKLNIYAHEYHDSNFELKLFDSAEVYRTDEPDLASVLITFIFELPAFDYDAEYSWSAILYSNIDYEEEAEEGGASAYSIFKTDWSGALLNTHQMVIKTHEMTRFFSAEESSYHVEKDIRISDNRLVCAGKAPVGSGLCPLVIIGVEVRVSALDGTNQLFCLARLKDWDQFPPGIRYSVKRSAEKPPVDYQIAVKTGDIPRGGTRANVYITLFGTNGYDEERPLGESSGYPIEKAKGKTDRFCITRADLGDITHIRIRHDDKYERPGWYLDEIRIRNYCSGKEYVFSYDGWLGREKDDGRIDRILIEQSVTPIEYEITVITGGLEGAGTDANIYMTLFGTTAISGEIEFPDPDETRFEEGETAKFIEKLPVLGEIESLRIRHDDTGDDSPWYLHEIRVKDRSREIEWIFPCDNWLGKDGIFERMLNPIVNPVEYKISVKTGDKEGAGTDAKVYITLSGTEGNDKERLLDNSGHDDFRQGKTDDFNIVASNLGDLRELRIRHNDKEEGSGWYLEEIRVLDKSAGKEWLFECDKWLATDEDDKRIDRTLKAQLIWTLGG